MLARSFISVIPWVSLLICLPKFLIQIEPSSQPLSLEFSHVLHAVRADLLLKGLIGGGD